MYLASRESYPFMVMTARYGALAIVAAAEMCFTLARRLTCGVLAASS